MIKVGFKKMSENAIIPTKAHPTDSGFDLCVPETTIIDFSRTIVVDTEIAIKLPPGYEAQVRPRSGVTSKTTLQVHLGTIDNGYTGSIGIIVKNTGGMTTRLEKGYKLAQLVIAPIPAIETYEFTSDEETERGKNGFGSSGY